MTKLRYLMLAFALALASNLAHAQDSGPLLDLLVKKKILTDQEAEDVRAELVKENANTSAGKLNLSSSVLQMKIDGDIRMRYQYDNQRSVLPPTDLVANPFGITPLNNTGTKPFFLPFGSIFEPAGALSYFKDANGNFQTFDPKTATLLTDGKGHFTTIPIGGKVPIGFSAAPLFARVGDGQSFYAKVASGGTAPFPSLLGGYIAPSGYFYQNNAGTFVPIGPGAKVPVGTKNTSIYASYNGEQKGGRPAGSQRDRFRFRLRIRDEVMLADNWFAGFELSTSPAGDSGNQTFGDPAGFSKYGIFISKAYLGWHNDWLRVTAGKQANPFYTTDLVWDPDINPDGIVEQIAFHKMGFSNIFSGGSSKDGKSVVQSSTTSDSPWELTLTMGQFIFSDNIENGLTLAGGTSLDEPAIHDHNVSTDAFLFEFQLLGSYQFDNKVKVTFAPGFMFYNAAAVRSLAGNNENQFSGYLPAFGTPLVHPAYYSYGAFDGPAYLGETRDLAIFLAPGDVSFKIGNLPVKLYWDFAWNTMGMKRAQDIYQIYVLDSNNQLRLNHSSRDDIAWLAGFQLGQNKKKGDIAFNMNFRQTGISAVDPNLNDSDFALGKLNTQGVKAGIGYNFTDFASINATYFYAWNLRNNLIGGHATGGAKIADVKDATVFQLDVNVKF